MDRHTSNCCSKHAVQSYGHLNIMVPKGHISLWVYRYVWRVSSVTIFITPLIVGGLEITQRKLASPIIQASSDEDLSGYLDILISDSTRLRMTSTIYIHYLMLLLMRNNIIYHFNMQRINNVWVVSWKKIGPSPSIRRVIRNQIRTISARPWTFGRM